MTAADPRLPDLDTWIEEARDRAARESPDAIEQASRFLAVTAAYDELRRDNAELLIKVAALQRVANEYAEMTGRA